MLLAYGTLCIYGWFFSEKQIFLPPPSTYAATDDLLLLPTSYKASIAALYLENPEAAYTILYSHGNASDLGTIRSQLESLREQGFSVFAYDYPGYGLSQGEASEAGTYAAIAAAYEYLTQTLQVPPEQIILHGFSVGGGPTTHLALNQPVGGVILESTFVDTFRVVTRIPLVPFSKFPSLQNIKQLTVPVLVIHGTEDRTIPVWHGKELYAAAPEPKQSLWVEGANHINTAQLAGDRYYEAIKSFANSLPGP